MTYVGGLNSGNAQTSQSTNVIHQGSETMYFVSNGVYSAAAMKRLLWAAAMGHGTSYGTDIVLLRSFVRSTTPDSVINHLLFN